MTQAVKDFLSRMQAELPAPLHLRGNVEARAAFLSDYERVLSGWSKDVLDAAWPVVLSRLEFWIWPRPQQIHDACKEVAGRARQSSDLDRRREDAAAMADRYVKQYSRHSQVAKLAKAEGWIGPLTKFVRESAWVQAQVLCRVEPIGWDASIADHLGHFSTGGEAYAAFRQTISGAIERSRIEVRVPRTLIRQWKEQNARDNSRPRQLA